MISTKRRNKINNNFNRRAQYSREIRCCSEYSIEVIAENHRKREFLPGGVIQKRSLGWHCHAIIKEPGNTALKRGARTNILFMLDSNIKGLERVYFTFHNHRDGLTPMNPYEWSRRTRRKVYYAIVDALGKRAEGELRKKPHNEEAYPLMRVVPYNL